MTSVPRYLLVAVAGLTFLPFLPSLGGSFLMWDDHVNFLANTAYRGLGWSHIKWMFTTTLLAVYTPLAWLSLGANYVVGGMDPWGYHLVNIVLHAGNAALLFLLGRRLLAASLPRAGEIAVLAGAAVAALVFGVHPLRVESVAWVTERRDVLCGWFYLLSVLAYVRAVGGPAGRTPWLALSVAAFAAALLSKGIAMTLPASLLLLDVYPLRRVSLGWRVLLIEKLPFACLALLAAAAAYVAAGLGSAWTPYGTHGLAARIGMVGYSAWFYPWKLIWPHPLLPLYELPPRIDLFAPKFLVPSLSALGMTIALVLVRRRVPGALAAWAHSLIVVSPVSGVLHAGHQLAHDRWSYLSGLGFALLAGAGVAWTLTAWKGGSLRPPLVTLVLVTTALALLGWGAGSWRQSMIWRSSESLWRAAVHEDPSCAICRTNLGAALVRGAPLLDPSRIAEAEDEFRAAIRLRQDRMEPYSNLGALLAAQRRYSEAAGVFREVARRWPRSPEGPLRLGMVRMDEGRVEEALPLLRAALQLAPEYDLTRGELARAFAGLGERRLAERRFADAAAIFLESIRLRPNNLEPLRGLGQALVEQGRAQEAVAPLRQARTLGPIDPRVCYWLARAYLETGDRTLADAEIATLRKLDSALAASLAGGR
jgi:Flp pilus assembly protein TadD